VRGSRLPKPILAKPSLQMTTVEPGLPLPAISIAERIAGPKDVAPDASILFMFSKIL